MIVWRLFEVKQHKYKLVLGWVGCASYTMSEFHVRNYMARRPHINQEPNVGTSAVANMCAELIECHTSGQTKEEYHVWKSSKKPVFLRLLLTHHHPPHKLLDQFWA